MKPLRHSESSIVLKASTHSLKCKSKIVLDCSAGKASLEVRLFLPDLEAPSFKAILKSTGHT